MTMDCRDCTDLLSALIDRELADAEIDEVKAHLLECASCCRECALLCCLDAEIEQAKAPETPAGLWEKVQSATRGLREPAAGTDAESLQTGTDGRVIDFVRARARLSRLGRV